MEESSMDKLVEVVCEYGDEASEDSEQGEKDVRRLYYVQSQNMEEEASWLGVVGVGRLVDFHRL